MFATSMKTIPSERRRQKLLRVMDGEPRLGPQIFHFNAHRRCEEILDWLILNRLTGAELYSWILDSYRGRSILKPIAEILRRIDRADGTAPVLHRDLLT